VRARANRKLSFGRSRRCGAKPKYLLSGFSRCGICGGPIQVIPGRAGTTPIRVYVCAYHRERGTCDSSLRRPVAALDAAMLGWIEANILTEEVITRVLGEVRRRLSGRADENAGEIKELTKKAAKLKAEIVRLGEAIVSTSEPPHALVKMMAEREASLATIEARATVLKAAPSVIDLEVRRVEKEAQKRLADLREVVQQRPLEARGVLEALLVGPITFTPIDAPEGRRFRLQGKASTGGVIGPSSIDGVPSGIRTRVTALKGLGPGPD
jgi:site-specific DNA recombinase